eukprot:4784408-Prymnesium_polylepis.1
MKGGVNPHPAFNREPLNPATPSPASKIAGFDTPAPNTRSGYKPAGSGSKAGKFIATLQSSVSSSLFGRAKVGDQVSSSDRASSSGTVVEDPVRRIAWGPSGGPSGGSLY